MHTNITVQIKNRTISLAWKNGEKLLKCHKSQLFPMANIQIKLFNFHVIISPFNCKLVQNSFMYILYIDEYIKHFVFLDFCLEFFKRFRAIYKHSIRKIRRPYFECSSFFLFHKFFIYGWHLIFFSSFSKIAVINEIKRLY